LHLQHAAAKTAPAADFEARKQKTPTQLELYNPRLFNTVIEQVAVWNRQC
jgi:hypothetical protein